MQKSVDPVNGKVRPHDEEHNAQNHAEHAVEFGRIFVELGVAPPFGHHDGRHEQSNKRSRRGGRPNLAANLVLQNLFVAQPSLVKEKEIVDARRKKVEELAANGQDEKHLDKLTDEGRKRKRKEEEEKKTSALRSRDSARVASRALRHRGTLARLTATSETPFCLTA